MRPTSALLFPLLLLLLPLRCHGRTVSRCELRDKLRDKIKLSERTQNLTDVVLTMRESSRRRRLSSFLSVSCAALDRAKDSTSSFELKSLLAVVVAVVCHLEKVSHRSTGFVTIYGQRATTTAAPATTTTTTTIPATNSTTAANQIVNSNATVPTPLSNSTSAAPVNQSAIGNQTVNSNQTEVNDGQDQDQEDDATGEEPEQEEEPEEEEPLPEVEEEEELVDGASEETYDEESEYLYANQGSKMDFHLDDWLKLMELLNEEENMFDEQMLVIADNKLSADDEDDSGGMVFQMEWSLGYHGLFQLSDSYFCQSTARWSQNACNSTCDGESPSGVENGSDRSG